MTYTALYRRFRPQLFGDLVGQPHISRTLAAAVKKGGFVHAYLFCGPRGTGKTSTAKILARAVNCLEPGATGEPCGRCPACLRSVQGESLDILEIDAASNRGIDEIRDLRERVKYAPVLEKYKVYIIDEVHMLTAPAFNALLKTLEEPPPHVLFILATTEPHKIPLTVLSRCQRFDFRRIADAEVEEHLRRVAEAEGYTAEREALSLIARKVEGGLRDALSLLDQCAGASGGQITLDVLHMLTGAAGRDFIEAMTRHMVEGNTAELLTGVAALYSSGHDLRQFLHDLLEYQRELLLLKLSHTKQAIPVWAAAARPALLLKLLSTLAEGEARLRNSLQPRLTLELALLAACGVPEDRSERREDREQIKEKREKMQDIREKIEEKKEKIESAPVLAQAETTAVQDGEGGLARLQELWPAIVQAVSRANNSTGAFFAEAEPVEIKQNKLILCFGAQYALFMNNVCKQGPARKLVEEQIAALYGHSLSIEGTLAPAQEEAPPSPAETEQTKLF